MQTEKDTNMSTYVGHECSAAYNPIGYEATRLTQIKQEVKNNYN